MKVLSKLALIGLLISPSAYATLFSISEVEINRYLQTRLEEKIPLKNQIGIPHLLELDYQLSGLSTQIGRTEAQRVAISGLISGMLTAKGKAYQAQIHLNLDTLPYYDPEKGAIYLRDIRLLTWSATPDKYQDELHTFLPLLTNSVANILNNTPVYTLDETKMKEALFKKVGKAILVKSGELQLETSIF